MDLCMSYSNPVRPRQEDLQCDGSLSLSLKRITIDFEKALWSAIGQLLPDVDIRGCAFHMTQALWRKVSKKLL